MKTIKMASKNLFRQKRRTILLASAIGFGILFITMINGFTGSFVENVGENFSHLMAGHIFVSGVEKSSTGKQLNVIRDDELLYKALEENKIDYKYITRRSEFMGEFIFNGKNTRSGVSGADWERETYFKDRIIIEEGSFEDLINNHDGIIITDQIAKDLNLSVGDKFIVKMETYSGQYNAGDFMVAAIMKSSDLIGSMSCYANLSYVNELIDLAQDEYQVMGIYLSDGVDGIEPVAKPLYNTLGKYVDLFDRSTNEENDNPYLAILSQQDEEEWDGLRYEFITLNDILSEVEEIVRVLNIAGFIILLILFFIIIVGVTNTFRIVLFERIKEIGTMRAVGMQKRQVEQLFITEAFFLALLGIAGGLIVAGLAMGVLHSINFGTDTAAFMLLKNGHMTFKITPIQMTLNLTVVLLLTMLAAYFPVKKNAKIPPAEALRTTK